MSDEELVRRIREGDTALFEILMRRYNTRLYRVARGILRDDAEAEDVMQQAYVNAFIHLDQFADRAKFSTWLTKIAVYEALARTRRARRETIVAEDRDAEGTFMDRLPSPDRTPEAEGVRTRARGAARIRGRHPAGDLPFGVHAP